MVLSIGPAIITVSDDGVLRPRRDGVTTVIDSNSGLQDTISVEVLNIGDLVFTEGFEP